MIQKQKLTKIGYFTKPHGIKGEIGLSTTYDVFEETDEPYIVCEIDGIPGPFFIEEYRYKSDTIILVKLENINSEVEIKEFVNLDVYYPSDAIPAGSQEDTITWNSFIGYTVSDEKKGPLGKITDVDESTINILLQIDYNGNELLIPAADELILSVDHTTKQLTVSVPDGLLEM